MNISLRGPGIYIPEHIITNKTLEGIVDTSDDWIVNMTGIKERRFSLDKDVRQMAVLATKNLLDKLDYDPGKIDEVIFAINRHHKDQGFPNHAGYVAASLKSKKDIIAHDSFAGCTGLVYAIRSAYNNVLSGDVNSVLVIGSERLTDMTDYSDRNTCILFGDGAGAYIVEKSEEEGILANSPGGSSDIGNEEWPNGFLGLEYKNGKKLMLNSDGFSTYERSQNYLFMNGREVFKFATRVMRKTIHDALHKTDFSLEDVDVIIPHGANFRITDAVDTKLREKGFKGRVYTNLDRFGNTSTASIAIAEAEAIDKRIIKDGYLIIRVGFGAGFTWAANISRYHK